MHQRNCSACHIHSLPCQSSQLALVNTIKKYIRDLWHVFHLASDLCSCQLVVQDELFQAQVEADLKVL